MIKNMKFYDTDPRVRRYVLPTRIVATYGGVDRPDYLMSYRNRQIWLQDKELMTMTTTEQQHAALFCLPGEHKCRCRTVTAADCDGNDIICGRRETFTAGTEHITLRAGEKFGQIFGTFADNFVEDGDLTVFSVVDAERTAQHRIIAAVDLQMDELTGSGTGGNFRGIKYGAVVIAVQMLVFDKYSFGHDIYLYAKYGLCFLSKPTVVSPP